MEEQTTNNPLSDLEISEILGESSSEAGVYANIVDTDCEVVEPLAIPETVETIDNDWERYHPVLDAASGESHTDTTILTDTVFETTEEATEPQPEPESKPELDNTQLMKELSNMQTLRFKGASWFENMKDSEIIVAGVGGIGSWVALLLSRMTPSNIVLFDDDNVELTNMAGQCYMEESIGESKVTAMQNVCEKMSRYKSILGFQEKFNYDSVTADIMICGFDNMSARRTFYGAWKQRVTRKKTQKERAKCILIDGRLLMEEFQVFALTGDNEENMRIYDDKFLFTDSEMVEPLCSQKQTSHIAAMIASVMVGILTNFLSPCKEWEVPRKVPFLTEFDMPSMMFKTQM